MDNFALPGDAAFPLNALYHAPASRPDAGEFLSHLPRPLSAPLSTSWVWLRFGSLIVDALRSYLTQTRSELSQLLVDRLYPTEQEIGADGNPTGQTGARATKPSKWWMSFQKRRYVRQADRPTLPTEKKGGTLIHRFMGRSLGA